MKKKYLVTGGFGLLGVSLVNFLLKKKAKVVVLDYKSKRKNFFPKTRDLKIEIGDFCNPKVVVKRFKKSIWNI